MTEYETLKSRVDTDDGTYWWALMEIERLREALREISQEDMQFTVKKIGHLSVKYGPYAKIANAALGEGKE